VTEATIIQRRKEAGGVSRITLRELGVGDEVIVAVSGSNEALSVLAVSAPKAQQPPQIVPGERIGSVHLKETFITALTFLCLNCRTVAAPEFFPETVQYQFLLHGLEIVADKETKNILDIQITAMGRTDYHSSTTAEGLGLESTEEEVVAVMGTPEKTIVAEGGFKGLEYFSKGIAFYLAPVDTYGVKAGHVAYLEVFWKVGTPGEPIVAPGQSIAGVELGMTINEAIEKLGGGYNRHRFNDGSLVYAWGHYGLLLVVGNDRVAEVYASWNIPWTWEDSAVRYATDQGLGLNSKPEEIVSALGQPPTHFQRFDLDLWAYPTLGLRFFVNPKLGRVDLIGIVPKSTQSGICLNILDNRNDAVVITLDTYPGMKWTYAPGEHSYPADSNNNYIRTNSAGQFDLHTNISGDGDNRFVSWEWHPEYHGDGVDQTCPGAWRAVLHY